MRLAARLAAIAGLAALAACASGPRNLAELRGASAQLLDGASIRALASGNRFTGLLDGRGWSHNEDGSLSLLTRDRTTLASYVGRGQWRVSNDLYCVDITWQLVAATSKESWCAQVWRHDERHYLVGTLASFREGDQARAFQFSVLRTVRQDSVRP